MLALGAVAENNSVLLVHSVQEDVGLAIHDTDGAGRMVVSLTKVHWLGRSMDGVDIQREVFVFALACGEPTVEMMAEVRTSMKSVEVLAEMHRPPKPVAINSDPELQLAAEYLCGTRKPPQLPPLAKENPQDVRVLACSSPRDTSPVQLLLNETASRVTGMPARFTKTYIEFVGYEGIDKPKFHGLLDRFTGSLVITPYAGGKKLYAECVLADKAKF